MLYTAPGAACTATAAPACKPCAGCTGAEQSQVLFLFFLLLNCCHLFLSSPPPHATMHGVKSELTELRCKGGTGGCVDPEQCCALGLPEGWGSAREQHPFYLQSGTERKEHKGLLSALGLHSGQARAKKGSIRIYWQAEKGNGGGVGRAGLSRAYGCPHSWGVAGGISRE